MYNAKNTTNDPGVALNKNAAGKGAFFQPKLTINEPGDSYEQEADAMADHVMRMADTSHNENAFFKPAVSHLQRKCHHCEEDEKLHRKESTDGDVQGSNNLDSYVSSLGSQGQPLPETSRKFFEPRFGYDFSNVRIHNDSVAAKSTQSINALAYTTGNNIVFNNGQYSPDSDSGKRLMAHELTHVVQQNDSFQSKPIQRIISNEPNSYHSESKDSLQPVIHTKLIDRKLQLKHKKNKDKGLKIKSGDSKHSQEEEQEASEPSKGAIKAISAAQSMHDQNSPVIWYDDWGNDERDNDLDGKIDNSKEQRLSDGIHYGKSFTARVCKKPGERTDKCPPADQNGVNVSYKVCIDIPIEAYKTAGIPISLNRWIPTFFNDLEKSKYWKVWRSPSKPSSYLDGDIVAAQNSSHQHAGIVSTGIINNVINLPGPTAAHKYGVFKPSGTNDIVSVPRVLFEGFLSIDAVARPKI